MTQLRDKYQRDMTVRGLALRTQQAYTSFVADLARYFKRSPDRISYDEVVDWIHHLIRERKLASSSVNIAVNAVRFFYAVTLQRKVDELLAAVPRMKRNTRRAEVYARSELEAILTAPPQPRDRAFLMTVYAGGLRLSEAIALKTTDIDRARMQLRVRLGKGGKERVLPLSPRLLQELKGYWLAQRAKPRPGHDCPWLFLGTIAHQPINKATGQNIYYRAVEKSGVRRKGGIHVLRHSFATHCIESGLELTLVQRLLGHSSLLTTARPACRQARYLHVTAARLGQVRSPLDLIEFSTLVPLPVP